MAHLAPSSPLYNLAILLFTESVAWISGFIDYIDETYTQYSRGKFGVKSQGMLPPSYPWFQSTTLAFQNVEP